MSVLSFYHNKEKQRGNALFLILIAVALFAALSYAVTKSGRGSGNVSKEKNSLMAAQILQVGADLRTAAQRMRIAGLAADDIRFHANASATAACTVDDGTCLFMPSGGGAIFPVIGNTLPTEAFVGGAGTIIFLETTEDSGNTGQAQAVVDGMGTATGREGVFLVAGVTEGVCEAINKGLGVTGTPTQTAAALTANIGSGYITFDVVSDKTAWCMDAHEFLGAGAYGVVFTLLEQ